MNNIKKVIFVLFLVLTINEAYSQKIKVTNLGCVVNSSDFDYAPIVSPDGLNLYFVSVRPGSKIDAEGNPTHDFWAVQKLNKYDTTYLQPYNIDTNSGDNGINTSFNEGVATFSPDGKSFYFTACDRNNGIGSCDIYWSILTEDGWANPMNLGSGVNTNDWESQPSISPDGKTLYFISDRNGPNGKRNFDIWYSEFDDELYEWGQAKNLEEINTKGKEFSPFISADNLTLFFSSDGYKPNLGGLDFYVTKYNYDRKEWRKPAHLDYPLSTEFDDQYLSLPATGDVLYFASNRKDIDGYCGKIDLFMAIVPSFFKAMILKISVSEENSGDNVYSDVTIVNSTTGRKVKDKTSPIKKEVEMIISSTDFGNPKDSINFIDFEITAKNKNNEKTKKILRVKNPSKDDFDDLRDFTDKIGVTLEFADVTDSKKDSRKKSEFSILSANTNIWGIDGKNEYPLDTIYIEESASTYMRPLLNYIFFDHNSTDLSERYIKLKDKFANEFDLKLLHNRDLMFIYHNALNIIGRRMTDNPSSKITLIGCNSNIEEEKNNLLLSENRAKTLKNYFNKIWKIDEERIKISSRNLPEKTSNSDTDDGIQENRRVEIYCDNPQILAPIISFDTIITSQPQIIRFKDAAKVKFGEAYWNIKLFQKKELLKEFVGEGYSSKELDWMINDEKQFPSTDEPIICEIEVNDKAIRKTIVNFDTIPIKFITLKEKEEQKKFSKTIEKFSLILFDFGSNKLGKQNQEIVNIIKSKIKANSNISIIGFTDRVGNDNFNLKLSQSRAKSVQNEIKHSNLNVYGLGESKLLYENDIPEGRFYCRTVEITIENIIE